MRNSNGIYFKLLILLISTICGQYALHSQISNYTNGGNQSLDTKFIYPKIEVRAKQSFFNILIIKNNSGEKFNGNVQFDVPNDWNFVGDPNITLSLEAGDSINIPVRVMVSSKVLGEIAYVVVASVMDKNERQVKSEYCFITIPRLPNTKVKLLNDIAYFDQKTDKATFNYTIHNLGNINEIVNVELLGSYYMTVNNNRRDKLFSTSVSMPPHSDSTLIFTVGIDEKDELQQFYKVDIKTSTQDTVFKNSLWLNRIENKYELLIPEQNKCAIVELTINDLFSNSTPSYSFSAMGSILFKKDMDFYYYFQNSSLSSNSTKDFWGISTRVYVGFNIKYLHFQVGNIESKLNQNFYGRGVETALKLKKTKIEGFYLNGIVDSSSFYGGKFETSIFRKTRAMLGYAEMDQNEMMLSSKIEMAGLSFSLFKKNFLSIQVGQNQTTHSMYTPFTRNGFGYNLIYSLKVNKLAINVDADYGSPEYTGISRGKLFISSRLSYSFNNHSLLNISYYKRDDNPAYYINDTIQPERFRKFDKYEISHQTIFSTIFSINYGAIYQLEKSNQFYTLGSGDFFGTQNRRLFISGRINIPDTRIVIAPKLDVGNIIIDNAVELNTFPTRNYMTYNFALNITSRNLGVFIQYRNGPFDIYDQYYYYSIGYFSKRLFVMPYYERFFLNKKLQFLVRGNLQTNFNDNTNVATLTTQLAAFLPHQFSIRIMNSASTRTRKDALTNATLRYNSSYFQLGIRKEFNCNQPRVKYYDLHVVFFRDLNGNRVKEENEPGINNVLVNIDRDYSDSINVKRSINEFASTELLSDQTGTIEYLNIPNGNYQVKYILMGEIVGNFNREELTESFLVDDDKTVYIPYLENNKIFGSVVLNRDPLSSLGAIDISNIRILAEDTKGNSFSALTDKQGNFVLYTPVADNYIVKINNIFYESFDIQQSEYIVKFNGYKQFRVSFVFNEKKRKITFDTDVTKDEFKMDDLKVIRKTTLSGKIRDAISLEPIEASIKIIENTTNKVVAEGISNRLNGNYSISYVAGDKFRIEVKAAGYQDWVENLYIEQVISIQNIAKDLMLQKLSAGPQNKTFIIYDEKGEKDFTQNFKPGQKIPINNLNFDEKETRLKPDAYPELDRLIELLNKNKSVRIEIAGHADDTGKDRTDNILAMRRAEAVQKYLISHGLTENRVIVKSYSNTRPLVPGSSEKAKQKNRRVEITVL